MAQILGVYAEELRRVRNPRAFAPIHRHPRKYEAVDFETERPWVIVHDEHLHRENFEVLKRAGMLDRYIEVNTSRRPDDLRWAQAEIAARFGIDLRAGVDSRV